MKLIWCCMLVFSMRSFDNGVIVSVGCLLFGDFVVGRFVFEYFNGIFM